MYNKEEVFVLVSGSYIVFVRLVTDEDGSLTTEDVAAWYNNKLEAYWLGSQYEGEDPTGMIEEFAKANQLIRLQ